MSGTMPDDILTFWSEAGPEKWWKAYPTFDAYIKARFLTTWADAMGGRLDDWATTPKGALALVLVLDQFSRNMFRNDLDAFAGDTRARSLAENAIAEGFDAKVDAQLRPFFYMPFMHSERLADQDRSVDLFTALGAKENIDFARMHRGIVARFGRFPHRNAVLGRATTPEEQRFLDSGGFAG